MRSDDRDLEKLYRERSRDQDAGAPLYALAHALLRATTAIERLQAVLPPSQHDFRVDYGMVVLCHRLDELARTMRVMSTAFSRDACK